MQLITQLHPIKLTIFGDYWDSQLYKGRLYLWTMNGSIKVIDWDNLIEGLISDKDYGVTLECIFKHGDLLYSEKDAALWLKALNYKNRLMSDLVDLAARDLFIAEEQLEKYLILEIENPFSELPIDVDVYNDHIYSILDTGLWRVKLDTDTNEVIVSNSLEKLWDCYLFSLKARYGGRISLSGGDEGLFEYNVSYNRRGIKNETIKMVDKNVFRISSRHSLFTNWSYSSIYNSSDIQSSFLAAFSWDSNGKRVNFKGNIDHERIFKDEKHGNLSWGSGDKIYRATNDGLDIVRFTQSGLNKGEDFAFSPVKSCHFQPWKGKIICAGAAFFGTIIECENALVILQSNDEFHNIVGPITKWRAFPRSVRYENQLHVILDDKLEVYSFNHDYFINQNRKDFGIKKIWRAYRENPKDM